MSIPKGVVANFNVLLAAAKDGALGLLECRDAVTGEPRYVICAVNRTDAGAAFVPFGHMHADGNPYEAYLFPE